MQLLITKILYQYLQVSAVNSFWKQIYLKVTGGTFTQIDNVKFYTDGGGFGTGISTFVGDQLPTKNSGSDAGYVVATGTVGTSGNAMVASHAGVSAQTDAFIYIWFTKINHD